MLILIMEQVVQSTNKPCRSLGNNSEWAASQHHSHIIHSLPFTACRLTEGTILKFPLPPGGKTSYYTENDHFLCSTMLHHIYVCWTLLIVIIIFTLCLNIINSRTAFTFSIKKYILGNCRIYCHINSRSCTPLFWVKSYHQCFKIRNYRCIHILDLLDL